MFFRLKKRCLSLVVNSVNVILSDRPLKNVMFLSILFKILSEYPFFNIAENVVPGNLMFSGMECTMLHCNLECPGTQFDHQLHNHKL